MILTRWREEHAPEVKPMIEAFLKVGYDRGGDLMPSLRNVDGLWTLGLVGANHGDPCLVALSDGGQVVSYICWATVGDTLDARWKTLNTYGAYTLPGFRSTGIATSLRMRALEIAKERGYERVTGPVHRANERGMRYFGDLGAKVCSLEYEFFLKEGVPSQLR